MEFLETGRGIFWSQILRLRSPVDKLRHVAPQLADTLVRVSTELDAASHRVSAIEDSCTGNSQKILIEREASRLRRLNMERSNTLKAIRQLPRFTDFLLPQRLATLQRAAKTSPVVFLVANKEGSDCLVMTSTDVQHVRLPNLPTKTLQEFASRLLRTSTGKRVPRSFMEGPDGISETLSPVFDHLMCNSSTHDSEPDPDEGNDSPPDPGVYRNGYGKQWISSDTAFKQVLKVLWDEIVKPVIEVLRLQVCALNLLSRSVTHLVSSIVEVRRSHTDSVLVPHWPIRFPSYPCSRPI